jgi:hypothetical protein
MHRPLFGFSLEVAPRQQSISTRQRMERMVALVDVGFAAGHLLFLSAVSGWARSLSRLMQEIRLASKKF